MKTTDDKIGSDAQVIIEKLGPELGIYSIAAMAMINQIAQDSLLIEGAFINRIVEVADNRPEMDDSSGARLIKAFKVFRDECDAIKTLIVAERESSNGED